MIKSPVPGVSCVEFFDKAEDPDTCKCKNIVLNAYSSLRAGGVSDREAIKIVTKVLKYHHPSPSVEAKTVVECWVFENSQQSLN
jgi:diketogulonate reductase-like aldo/keto reductase